ncbi:MAG: DUF952 domain-containing protein [Usitatibacteraceae bacterium]
MIYRIAERADWDRAQLEGKFVSADLAAEGFIHCSERNQVARTARKYYAGKTSLLLLEIDEAALAANLVREDLTGSGVFPHSYGPIPLAAIVHHADFDANTCCTSRDGRVLESFA